MAKQICILGYVIAIILILSNVKNVSSNKNNQYAKTPTTTTTTTTAATATEAIPTTATALDIDVPTQPIHTSTTVSSTNAYPMSKMVTAGAVETKSISALHGEASAFMQHTLHNTSSTVNEEPSMQHHQKQEVQKPIEQPQNHDDDDDGSRHQHMLHSDAKNPKKQLIPAASVHEKQPLVHHDKFMNEKTLDAIESSTDGTTAATAETTTVKVQHIQSSKHNQPLQRINDGESSSDNNSNNGKRGDDSRKSDEIMAMPMKMLRDNVNATSDAADGNAMKVNKTFTDDNDGMIEAKRADPHLDPALNERSRYLETDLDVDGGELHDTSDASEPIGADVNVNDQLDWASDANKFEELSLSDDFDDDIVDDSDGDSAHDGGHHKAAAAPTVPNMQARSWAHDSSDIESHERINAAPVQTQSTQNIFKVSKPNKSKSMKHMPTAIAEAVVSAMPPQPPQALLEIRLSKAPPMSSSPYEKEFINAHSFLYVTELYDQYEWNADELRHVLSRECASEMYVFLEALVRGKTWAAKGKFGFCFHRFFFRVVD